jgi:hypothetical protein
MVFKMLGLLSILFFSFTTEVMANDYDGKYSLKGDFLSYSELSFELKDNQLTHLDFGASQTSDAVIVNVIDLGGTLSIEFSMGGGDSAFKDVILLENIHGKIEFTSASCIYFDYIDPEESFLKNIKITSFSAEKLPN